MSIRDYNKNRISFNINNNSLDNVIKLLQKLKRLEKLEKIKTDEIDVNIKLIEYS